MKKKILAVLLCTVLMMNMTACGNSTEAVAKDDMAELNSSDKSEKVISEEDLETAVEVEEEPTSEPTPEPTPTEKPKPNVNKYEVKIYDYYNEHPIIGVNCIDGWKEPEIYNGLQRTETNRSVFKLEPPEKTDVESVKVIIKEIDATGLMGWEADGDSGNYVDGYDQEWQWKKEKEIETCWGNMPIYYFNHSVQESENLAAYQMEKEVGVLDVSGQIVLFTCTYISDLDNGSRGYLGKLEELVPAMLEVE